MRRDPKSEGTLTATASINAFAAAQDGYRYAIYHLNETGS